MIGLFQTIDRLTHGVFEQESLIVWTDYATLSPFLMTFRFLIQVFLPKKG